MIKTAFTTSVDWQIEPVQLIPVSRKGVDRGFFEKQASFLSTGRSTLRPVEGHTPVFVLAMSAGEITGSNRNADYWAECGKKVPIHKPEGNNEKFANTIAGLREKAGTFVTHGKIYRDHKNSDPSLSSGSIFSAEYNEKMGRVETISLLKNSEWHNEIDAIAAGEHVSFSMSARVRGDICSYCGNKARTKSDYCNHIKKFANMVLDDGHQVVMINVDPTFFDLSGVRKNADRIGFGLAKVASVPFDKTGAFLASELSIHCPEETLLKVAGVKLSNDILLLQKLSNIEKSIEASAVPSRLSRAADPRTHKPISKSKIVIMRSSSPGALFKALERSGMMLSMPDFFKTMLGDKFSSIGGLMNSIHSCLPGVFTRIREGEDLDEFLQPGRYRADEKAEVDEKLNKTVEEIAPDFSLDDAPVRHRIVISISSFDKDPEITKKSGVLKNPVAEFFARQYALYQISALSKKASADKLFITVLGNYLQ